MVDNKDKPGKGGTTFKIVLGEDWISSEDIIDKYWQDEWEKCIESPYYFYTNYMTVNGKKATTSLTEEEFNKQFSK